ncbi:hypothetical protein ACB098_05G139600 [Castanea mollissima]
MEFARAALKFLFLYIVPEKDEVRVTFKFYGMRHLITAIYVQAKTTLVTSINEVTNTILATGIANVISISPPFLCDNLILQGERVGWMKGIADLSWQLSCET